ncbi:MAG TPA: hypothetical protein VJ738_08415 [Steroidobacteraceae bacterium]|nr:hypothetical protein [Steroidobacteraceae bacterium]
MTLDDIRLKVPDDTCYVTQDGGIHESSLGNEYAFQSDLLGGELQRIILEKPAAGGEQLLKKWRMTPQTGGRQWGKGNYRLDRAGNGQGFYQGKESNCRHLGETPGQRIGSVDPSSL